MKSILKKIWKSNLEEKNKGIDSGNLYSGQHLIFDVNELRTIHSIGTGSKNGSTFILHIMRSLYKASELKKLHTRNPTGRQYKGQKKQEITMQKKEIMNEMLSERVSYELGGSSPNFFEFSQRTAKLNDHIRHAIRNILKKDLWLNCNLLVHFFIM